ncbi:MAG: hypothetical protein ACRD9Q_06690 [Nitrososphaeraceae archaeon]
MTYLKSGIVTTVDIEDITPRRDYKLVYVFGCISCVGSKYENLHTTIFLHRTDEDIKSMASNVYQKCGQGHITRPFKRCTKCHKVYTVEDIICVVCEQGVIDIAKCEVLIENRLKDVSRLNKQFKRKKIQEAEYSDKLTAYYEEINSAQKELDKMEETKKHAQ